MLQIDSILGSAGLVVNSIVSTIVKNNAVLQNLTYAGSFMIISGFQDFYGARSICCYGTGKEVPTGAKTELCRAEWILYCTIG